jgi:hypothetical protein
VMTAMKAAPRSRAVVKRSKPRTQQLNNPNVTRCA